MEVIEILLLLAGFVSLVIGYRRNARNLMVTSALLLFLAGGFSQFVEGFWQGFTGSAAHTL